MKKFCKALKIMFWIICGLTIVGAIVVFALPQTRNILLPIVMQYWLYISIGGGILGLLLLISIITSIVSHRKSKKNKNEKLTDLSVTKGSEVLQAQKEKVIEEIERLEKFVATQDKPQQEYLSTARNQGLETKNPDEEAKRRLLAEKKKELDEIKAGLNQMKKEEDEEQERQEELQRLNQEIEYKKQMGERLSENIKQDFEVASKALSQKSVSDEEYQKDLQGSESEKQAQSLRQDIQELREEIKQLKKYDVATNEEKKSNEKLATTEKELQRMLLEAFKDNPDWLPFSVQDMIDYDVKDLFKYFLIASKLQQKKVEKASPQEQQIFKEQAQNFERNYYNYQERKESSQYEELLKEMREIKEENKAIKEKLENSEKRQEEKKELDETKRALAESQKEIERLKEKSLNDKLDEALKKNETLTTPQPKQSPQTNMIVNTYTSSSDKLEFSAAFEYLKEEQKKYFEQLRDYALSKEKARIKPTKYNFTVGIGNFSFIKFIVKYSTLIAVFGTTEIKLENRTAFENAKQMIDNKVKDFLDKK